MNKSIKDFEKFKLNGCITCGEDNEEIMPYYKCRICNNSCCYDCYKTNEFFSEDTCNYCLTMVLVNLKEKYNISEEDMDYLDYVLHI